MEAIITITIACFRKELGSSGWKAIAEDGDQDLGMTGARTAESRVLQAYNEEALLSTMYQ